MGAGRACGAGVPGARYRRRIWLLPAVLAVHVLEEAPGFTRWARRHTSERYTRSHFARVNTLGIAGTVAATVTVAHTTDRRLVFGYQAGILSQQALFNPVFHAVTAVAYRSYSPGLASALGLFPAVWAHLTRLALGEGLLNRRQVATAAGLGAVIHALAGADQVYFVGRRARLRTGV